MKNVNQLKMGTILSYINIIISTIVPIFYTPIMLNILGQKEYGLYSLSNSVIGYLSLLNFGMSNAVMRYVVKQKQDTNFEKIENLIGMFVVIYCIFGLLALLVGLGIIPFSSVFFSSGLSLEELNELKILILIMTLSTAISFPSVVFSAVVIAYEKFIFRRFFEIILTIIAPILNLIALFMGGRAIGIALSGLIIQIGTAPIYLLYCRNVLQIVPKFNAMPFYLMKEIIPFSAFVFLSLVVDMLYWSTDKILIGAMMGTAYVAVYNIGNTFTSMLQNMTAAISNVFVPRINSIVFTSDNVNDLNEIFIRIGRLQFYILALILSGFIVFGKNFIHFWAGDEYLDGYIVALVVMIPLSIPLIQNIAYNVILAKNKHHFRAYMYFVIAVINIIFTYISIPNYGIIGAAICSGIAYFIGNGIIMNIYYSKVIHLNILGFWKNIFKISLVSGFEMCFFIFIVNNFIQINSVQIFLIFVTVYTILYIFLMWFFSFNKYEKNLFISLIKKLN
ncbi:MAG: oligosaccharide flippase family protein [Massilimicrobiota timonensis]